MAGRKREQREKPAAREASPWQRCAACPRCGWWTGWLCLNEPAGFRDCRHYGKVFTDERILCRGGKTVTLTRKKGESDEQLRLRAFPEETRQESGVTHQVPAGGINLFEL